MDDLEKYAVFMPTQFDIVDDRSHVVTEEETLEALNMFPKFLNIGDIIIKKLFINFRECYSDRYELSYLCGYDIKCKINMSRRVPNYKRLFPKLHCSVKVFPIDKLDGAKYSGKLSYCISIDYHIQISNYLMSNTYEMNEIDKVLLKNIENRIYMESYSQIVKMLGNDFDYHVMFSYCGEH